MAQPDSQRSTFAKQPRVFLSYAREDGQDYARELRARLELEEPEITLWRDREEMVGGRGWWRQIEEALNRAEFLVLVLTPCAARSEIVLREWRHARQQGVSVVPVRSPHAPIDLETVPQWISKIHCYDLAHEWEIFVQHLKSPSSQLRIPFMAPDIPEEYVDRPRESGLLLKEILEPDGQTPLAITTALHGAGGFGKSALAAHFCHEDRVITAFDDGILWIELGETPDVLGELITAYAALTGDRPGFANEHDASQALAAVLTHKHCLLVLDDVWDLVHAQPFLRGGATCTRLITTRQFDIAVGAKCLNPVTVDEMQPDEALAMLAGSRDDALAPETGLELLAARLGEWPLMLELARAAIGKRTRRGESFEAAIAHISRRLEIRGIQGLGARNQADRRASISATMDISLDHLDHADRQTCLELSVFAEGVDIPMRALEALSGIDEVGAEDCAERLADSSLVRVNLNDGTVRLHDVVREYLGEQLKEPAAVHSRLIAGWGGPNALPDAFAWRWIGYHILRSGAPDQLEPLLFDILWLDAKLRATHPNELIADCDRWLAQAAERPNRQAVELVLEVFRLSSHLIGPDPDQLAGQMVGRLTSLADQHLPIRSLIEQTFATRLRPCLLPTNSILSPPGGPLTRTLEGHSAAVSAVCVTTDCRLAISVSEDETLKVWDLETGREIWTLEAHSRTAFAVCVTADGRRVISGAHDYTLRIWDLETGRKLRTIEDDTVTAVCLIAEGRRVISASSDPTLTDPDTTLNIWDLETGREVSTFEGPSGSVEAMCATADGRFAITASDETLKVWDLETGRELQSLEGHSDTVTAVCVTTDGRRVISGSRDSTVRIWDLETGDEIRTIEGHSDTVETVCVTPDGRRVISASDSTLKVWDLETGRQLQTLEGHGETVWTVCVTADGRRAISGAEDRTLKVWDLEAGATFRTLEGHGAAVSALSIAADGKRMISAAYDGTLKIWDLETRDEIRTLECDAVGAVCVTADGRRAILVSSDQTLEVWDLETGTAIRRLEGHSRGVYCIAVAADGRRAISCWGDETLKVWDLETGAAIRTLQNGLALSVCISADGRRAISNAHSTLKVWDLETGREIRTLEGHNSSVFALCVTADGRMAISGSEDETLKVWDLDTGREIWTLRGHSERVMDVCTSADGRRAISVSRDQSLMVWDLATGANLATFCAESRLSCCAISPDGTTVVAGEFTGRLHFLSLIG